jgi:hypothetical protein
LARALDVIGVDGLTVIARIRDAQGPLHSRSYEAAGSSRPTGTPPPGTGRTDRAQHDERDLDACVTGAAQAINRAWSIIGNYPPAHAANATERAALGLGDGPWCASCARTVTSDRLSGVENHEWRADSLVGSFFHSDASRTWQGCVVAEPVPGVYLVELFNWLIGVSGHQRLVDIREMTEWCFYDTAEWMRNCTDEVQAKWDRARAVVREEVNP